MRQVGDQGDINPCPQRVAGVSQEGLDLGVLPDEAKEYVDLPAFLLDICDGLGRELEVVGEEDQVFLRLGVPIADAAEGTRTFDTLRSGQHDSAMT